MPDFYEKVLKGPSKQGKQIQILSEFSIQSGGNNRYVHAF